MNFFSSLLGEEAPLTSREFPGVTEQDASKEPSDEPKETPQRNPLESSGFLTFFGSLAKKSEEVLSTYQKDLAEFGQELKKETFSVVDTSAKAIPEVPHLLESGAHQAQNNLEKVGHVIEDFGSSFWRGTTEIFGQVKDVIKQADQEVSTTTNKREKGPGSFGAIPRGKYSRFEAQVNAMQRDSSTYCDEPEDADDYAKWKEEFKLDDKKEEIEKIAKENAFMQELQSRIVPLIVEYDTFWTRYFYRLHKLKQAEEARAGLVKRASAPEEEELSWDVDEPGTPGGPRQIKSPRSPQMPSVPEGEQQHSTARDKLPDPSTADSKAAADITTASADVTTAPADVTTAPADGTTVSADVITPKADVTSSPAESATEAAGSSTPAETEKAADPPSGGPNAASPGGEEKDVAEESKKDSPVVPASPRGPSEEEGTHSDGSPEGSTGSGWFVVGKGAEATKTAPEAATPPVDEKGKSKEAASLEVDDLDVEEPEGAPEVSQSVESKGKPVKGSEEEGEDWGAWE